MKYDLRAKKEGALPTEKLKTFSVQGWRKLSPAANQREPMRQTKVQAINGKAAAETYARCNGIPDKFWNDGSDSPLIVIRVS